MKNNREIDNALRHLAQERDKRLGLAPMLTPARQASLKKVLSKKFPLESALHRAGEKRDYLLNLPAAIPAAVGLVVQERISAQSNVYKSSGALWRRLVPSPFAAALAVCVMITAGFFFHGYRETPSRRNARNLKPGGVSLDSEMAEDRWFLSRAELFTRKASIRPFNLEKTEPASLQASFLTSSGMYFADENDARLGLRLDLPVKAFLMEQDLARTP